MYLGYVMIYSNTFEGITLTQSVLVASKEVGYQLIQKWNRQSLSQGSTYYYEAISFHSANLDDNLNLFGYSTIHDFHLPKELCYE